VFERARLEAQRDPPGSGVASRRRSAGSGGATGSGAQRTTASVRSSSGGRLLAERGDAAAHDVEEGVAGERRGEQRVGAAPRRSNFGRTPSRSSDQA